MRSFLQASAALSKTFHSLILKSSETCLPAILRVLGGLPKRSSIILNLRNLSSSRKLCQERLIALSVASSSASRTISRHPDLILVLTMLHWRHTLLRTRLLSQLAQELTLAQAVLTLITLSLSTL